MKLKSQIATAGRLAGKKYRSLVKYDGIDIKSISSSPEYLIGYYKAISDMAIWSQESRDYEGYWQLSLEEPPEWVIRK